MPFPPGFHNITVCYCDLYPHRMIELTGTLQEYTVKPLNFTDADRNMGPKRGSHMPKVTQSQLSQHSSLGFYLLHSKMREGRLDGL